jgi:hypothetical protein
MLTTLLESAAPDQQRPSTRDTLELVQGGLRARLGLGAVPGLQAGLRIAGPIALTVCVADALELWVDNRSDTILIVTAAFWFGAALAMVVVPRLLAATIGLAWIVTFGAAVAAFLAPGGGPQIMVSTAMLDSSVAAFLRVVPNTFSAQLVCGLVALFAALTVHWRPSIVERAGLGAAVAAVLTLVILQPAGTDDQSGAFLTIITDAVWMPPIRLLPVALILAGVVLVIVRRSTALLWAGAVLLVIDPVLHTWHGPVAALETSSEFWPGIAFRLVDFGPLGLIPDNSGFFAVLPRGVSGSTALAAIIAVAVFLANVYRPAGQPPTARPRDGRSVLSTLSALALGAAGGICGYIVADMGYHGGIPAGDFVAAAAPLAAAIAVPRIPVRLRRPLLFVAMVPLLVTAHAGGSIMVGSTLIVLALLLLLAAADVRVSEPLVVVAAVAAVVTGIWLEWLNLDELWQSTPSRWQFDAVPIAGGAVLIFALVWAPVVLFRAQRGRVGATLAFVAGLLWLGMQLWTAVEPPELVASLSGVAVLVTAAVLIVRRRGAVAGQSTVD